MGGGIAPTISIKYMYNDENNIRKTKTKNNENSSLININEETMATVTDSGHMHQQA